MATVIISSVGVQGPQGIQGPYPPTGSFATTGSNVFRGDQTVTGSIAISGSVIFPNNYGGIYTTTTTGTQVQSFFTDQGNNLIFRATSSGDYYFYEGNNVVARFVNGGTINLGGTSATAAPLMRISPTINTFTFRNNGGDNGLNIKTNVGTATNNIQAIIRPNVNSTTNGGMSLASAGVADANSNHLVIASASNGQASIGIGTFAPSHSLDVSGSGRFTNSIYATGSVYITGSLFMNGNKQFNYGAFYDIATQTGTLNASQSFQFRSSSYTSGVAVTNDTRIGVTHAGIYNLQFSAQVVHLGTQPSTIWIWLKKNGNNVANTATRLQLTKDLEVVAAWNFVEQINSTDYVEIAWQGDDADIRILAEPASGNLPGIPSLILTVTQVA